MLARLLGIPLLATLVPSDETPPRPLSVDPLLLAEAAQVWQLAARPDNPLWPGWDASSTPILFYIPGSHEILVNHPGPPPGFLPAAGRPAIPGFDVVERRGSTVFELDGQNTARDVGGVTTLVVADPLSNLRVQVQSLLEAAAAGSLDASARDVPHATLATDPYDQMAMVAHEAFHVFQEHGAPKAPSELAVLRYPVLSVDNNVGMALEGEALASALEAEFDDEVEEAALRWLAIRSARRAGLPTEAVAYEDGNEWNEGLAKYVEYRLFQELEGRSPVAGLEWAQGFHGLDDLSAERRGLVDRLRAMMSGRTRVNQDPFGTAPARMRLYFSGMALGVLLDRLGVTWHERILQPGTTLTGLVSERLDPEPGELEALWQEECSGPGVAALREEKTRLEAEGREANERLARSILDGPATALVIDYSLLHVPGVGLSFTPFGVRVVDDEHVVYTAIPLRAQFTTGYEVRQTTAMPLLQEKTAERLTFQLQEVVSRAVLEEALGAGTGDGTLHDAIELTLPGATLSFARARVECSDRRIVFQLLPR